MGAWGRNIAVETLHVSTEICLKGSNCSSIKTRARLPVET
jgi:hypothetical protein